MLLKKQLLIMVVTCLLRSVVCSMPPRGTSLDILNETLFATEAAQNNNTLTANIARKQKDNVAAAQSNIVNEILRGGPLRTTWNEQTEQLYFQEYCPSRRTQVRSSWMLLSKQH